MSQNGRKEFKDQHGYALPNNSIESMSAGIDNISAIDADVGSHPYPNEDEVIVNGQIQPKSYVQKAEEAGLQPRTYYERKYEAEPEPLGVSSQDGGGSWGEDVDYGGLVSALLRNGDTLDALTPEQQAEVQTDDALIHYVSSTIMAQENNPEKAQEAIRGTLDQLGYNLNTIDYRAGSAGRFMAGFDNTMTHLKEVGGSVVGLFSGELPTKDDATSKAAAASKAEMEANSKLYSSMNPTRELADMRELEGATDLATPIGSEVPSALAGGGAGTLAKSAGARTLKTVATADLAASTAVDVASQDFTTPEQLGATALAALIGYNITPKGAVKVRGATDKLIEGEGVNIELSPEELRKIFDTNTAEIAQFKGKAMEAGVKPNRGLYPGFKLTNIESLREGANNPSDFINKLIESPDTPKAYKEWAKSVKSATTKEMLGRGAVNASAFLAGFPVGAFVTMLDTQWGRKIMSAVVNKADRKDIVKLLKELQKKVM